MRLPLVVLSVCVLGAGCSHFGIARREAMLPPARTAVSLTTPVNLPACVQQAAVQRKWTVRSTAADVIRCHLAARGWAMTVDVRCSGDGYTIEYVDSEGLFYEPETRRIHPGYNRRVVQLNQQIQREVLRAQTAATRAASAAAPAVASAAAPAAARAPVAPAKPYRIVSFAREPGASFAYRFELALEDAKGADLALARRIQDELRENVRAEYLALSGGTDARTLRIEFPDYALRDGKVTGRAVVLVVRLLEFVYDPNLRHGRLAVKVERGQYEQTRQWVRNNIATLARDKDKSVFARLSGTPRFAIGREVLREDNVLEVEFTTGEAE